MPAHDPAVFLGFDWSAVVVAIIAAVASVTNTLLIVWVYTQVRPPSGKHPGKTLDDAVETSRATNLLVTRIARESGIDVPEPGD